MRGRSRDFRLLLNYHSQSLNTAPTTRRTQRITPSPSSFEADFFAQLRPGRRYLRLVRVFSKPGEHRNPLSLNFLLRALII